MTFFSRDMLQQRRELGLAPIGGRAQDDTLLDLSSLPAGALQARLQRLDDLLKALWSHPHDLRVMSTIDDLVHTPNRALRSAYVHEAALFVHHRDRGEFASLPERLDHQRRAYEHLRCLAVTKALA